MYEESIEKESQNIEEFYFPSKFYFRSVPPKIRRNEANSIRSNTILKSTRTPTLSLSLSVSLSISPLSKTFLLSLSCLSYTARLQGRVLTEKIQLGYNNKGAQLWYLL